MTRKSREPRRRSQAMMALLLASGLVAVVAIYGLIVRLLLPGWAEGAQFGEAFGALNALFSGVALIGVAYALWLQQRQLAEMRRSIILQQQPLLSIEAQAFLVDRPQLFIAPERPTAEVTSRYHCRVYLTNISQFPAVGTLLRATLRVPAESGTEVTQTMPRRVPLIAPAAESDVELMFVPSGKGDSLFRVLRERDAFSLPKITVEVAFRNLVGAAFLLRQDWLVVPTDTIDSDLRSWHAALVSFCTEHQREIGLLSDAPHRQKLFDALRNVLAASLGDRENLELELVSLPETFSANTLTSDQYERIAASAGASRFTFADTVCPRGAPDGDER